MAAAGAPAKPRDLHQSPQSQPYADSRQPRASTRTLDGCRPHAAEGMAALPDVPRSAADHFAAAPPASVATGHPLSATGDVSMSASSQDSTPESTGGSSSDSPSKRPRITLSPHGFLDLAKQFYAPGPADPVTPSAERLTCPTELAPLPPTPQEKASSKPKLLTVVKKTIPAKPDKMPHRPGNPKFPVFDWGPYKIGHGGSRAAYRVSSYPGSRDTKLFKSWADVCKHLQLS